MLNQAVRLLDYQLRYNIQVTQLCNNLPNGREILVQRYFENRHPHGRIWSQIAPPHLEPT